MYIITTHIYIYIYVSPPPTSGFPQAKENTGKERTAWRRELGGVGDQLLAAGYMSNMYSLVRLSYVASVLKSMR